MDVKTLSRELWIASNLITAFAVLQSIAFTYACSKPEFSNVINTVGIKTTMLVLIMLVTVAESYAIWWCSKKQTTLILIDIDTNSTAKLEMQRIIRYAARGRIFAVSSMMIVSLIALYAQQLCGAPLK